MRKYTAPRTIAAHPGVEECLDASTDSDYKHDIFLREGWKFTRGRAAGCRGHRVHSVAEFRYAEPRRLDTTTPAPAAAADTTTPASAAITTTAAEWVQTFPVAVLAAVARNEVNLNRIARQELAARGLDTLGSWVGFPEAKRIAERVKPTRDDYRAYAFSRFTASSDAVLMRRSST